MNEKSLLDRNTLVHKDIKVPNDNWLGKRTDLVGGLAYIESLKKGMAATTKLMNVVFVTHGGFYTEADRSSSTYFFSIPDGQSNTIAPSEIYAFMKGELKIDSKIAAISALKDIFDQMQNGGNFIISACRVGSYEQMGKALQALSEKRINIYLTPDYVSITGVNILGKLVEIQELVHPRINDNKKTYSNLFARKALFISLKVEEIRYI